MRVPVPNRVTHTVHPVTFLVTDINLNAVAEKEFLPQKKGVKEREGLTDAQKKRMLLSDQTNQGSKQVASQQHIMISGLHHLLIQLHHWWSSCSSVHKSTFVKTHWSCFSVVSDSS